MNALIQKLNSYVREISSLLRHFYVNLPPYPTDFTLRTISTQLSAVMAENAPTQPKCSISPLGPWEIIIPPMKAAQPEVISRIAALMLINPARVCGVTLEVTKAVAGTMRALLNRKKKEKTSNVTGMEVCPRLVIISIGTTARIQETINTRALP